MKKLFILFFFALLTLLFAGRVIALECGDAVPTNSTDLRTYIDNCQSKIGSLRQEQTSLKATLSLLTSKINLTQAQIRSTNLQIADLEKEISTLSTVITDLNVELDNLSAVYISRVREAYKRRTTNPLILFFASESFTTFQNRLKYIQTAEKRDQLILKELENARVGFNQQKTTKEEKQVEVQALKTKLESQKKTLSSQQAQKNQLLLETQNSEKKFQQLLSQAIAELEAIENIIAGKGVEIEVGGVNKDQIIAHVEPYRSDGDYCNSNGPHLHFTIANDHVAQNPFNFLKYIDYKNNSGGDSFNPTGNWDWPLRPQISFNQGYGLTWAIQNLNLWYKQHNGIDIKGSSDEVHAVKEGTLFQGSYDGKTNKTNRDCKLKYVRIHQQDDNYDTYYLHVNYF